jgi:hypothetical protein
MNAFLRFGWYLCGGVNAFTMALSILAHVWWDTAFSAFFVVLASMMLSIPHERHS